MTLFLQILAANVVLLFVLIAVHECGHWCFGRLAGLPRDQMRIRLFTFPQQVQIRDRDGWVSVSTFDRYFARLRELVSSTGRQFLYVAGGFAFETAFLVVATVVLALSGHGLYAIVAPGVSLAMYLVYVFAMDLPQSRALGRPWGDSTLLHALDPARAATVAAGMVLVRLGLIAWAAWRWLG